MTRDQKDALVENVLGMVDRHREAPFRSKEWLGDNLAALIGSIAAPQTESGERVVATIAEYAAEIGDQAGVGACETAGWLVSYFAEHPERLPEFLAGTLSIIDLPLGLHECGKLSWHGADGNVHFPADIRAMRTEKALP